MEHVDSEGRHMALSRDLAKRAFGAKGDDAVAACLTEIAAEDPPALSCGGDWKTLDRIFGGLAEGGLQALTLCFLGGRSLLSDDSEGVAVVLRPDMTGHVAAALAEIDRGGFQQQLVELDSSAASQNAERLWNRVGELRRFFSESAERRDAVVFLSFQRSP